MTRAAARSAVLRIYAFGLSERTKRSMEAILEQRTDGACVLDAEATANVAIIDIDVLGGRGELERQRERYPGRTMILLTADGASASALGGIVMTKPVDVGQFVKTLGKIAGTMAEERTGGGAARPRKDVVVPRPVHVGERARRGLARPTSPEAPAGPRVPADSALDGERGLATLQPRARHYYIGSQPDVDLAVPEELAKVCYEPGEFLQGFVRQAVRLGIESASVVALSGPGFGRIEVYPFARLVRTTATSASLYAAARAPLTANDIVIAPAPELPQAPASQDGVEPLEALTWRLALWASRGRLPAGTVIEQPVVLKHWPNLSRLLLPPHAVQIAGLWARRAKPLAATPGLLGIPQRYVFSFYSACAAQDLILADRRARPRSAATEAPPAGERQTLFRMMLDKLMQGRSD